MPKHCLPGLKQHEQAKSKQVLSFYHDCMLRIFDNDICARARHSDYIEQTVLNAAQSGDLKKLYNVLEKVDINKVNLDIKQKETGNTPLIISAENENEEVLSVLLSMGCDVTLRNATGKTVLDVASPKLQILILDAVNRAGASQSLLWQAAWQGNSTVVKRLLNLNPRLNVNGKNSEGLTPLLLVTRDIDLFQQIKQDVFASNYNPTAVVAELLHKQADCTIVDDHGRTALHFVAKNCGINAKNIISLLARKESLNVDVRDKDDCSALHFASKTGDPQILLALIDNGADVNARGNLGRTPLHITAAQGDDCTSSLLLNHGANILIVDDLGFTPADVAKGDKVGVVLREAWAEQRSHSSLRIKSAPSICSKMILEHLDSMVDHEDNQSTPRRPSSKRSLKKIQKRSHSEEQHNPVHSVRLPQRSRSSSAGSTSRSCTLEPLSDVEKASIRKPPSSSPSYVQTGGSSLRQKRLHKDKMCNSVSREVAKLSILNIDLLGTEKAATQRNITTHQEASSYSSRHRIYKQSSNQRSTALDTSTEPPLNLLGLTINSFQTLPEITPELATRTNNEAPTNDGKRDILDPETLMSEEKNNEDFLNRTFNMKDHQSTLKENPEEDAVFEAKNENQTDDEKMDESFMSRTFNSKDKTSLWFPMVKDQKAESERTFFIDLTTVKQPKSTCSVCTLETNKDELMHGDVCPSCHKKSVEENCFWVPFNEKANQKKKLTLHSEKTDSSQTSDNIVKISAKLEQVQVNEQQKVQGCLKSENKVSMMNEDTLNDSKINKVMYNDENTEKRQPECDIRTNINKKDDGSASTPYIRGSYDVTPHEVVIVNPYPSPEPPKVAMVNVTSNCQCDRLASFDRNTMSSGKRKGKAKKPGGGSNPKIKSNSKRTNTTVKHPAKTKVNQSQKKTTKKTEKPVKEISVVQTDLIRTSTFIRDDMSGNEKSCDDDQLLNLISELTVVDQKSTGFGALVKRHFTSKENDNRCAPENNQIPDSKLAYDSSKSLEESFDRNDHVIELDGSTSDATEPSIGVTETSRAILGTKGIESKKTEPVNIGDNPKVKMSECLTDDNMIQIIDGNNGDTNGQSNDGVSSGGDNASGGGGGGGVSSGCCAKTTICDGSSGHGVGDHGVGDHGGDDSSDGTIASVLHDELWKADEGLDELIKDLLEDPEMTPLETRSPTEAPRNEPTRNPSTICSDVQSHRTLSTANTITTSSETVLPRRCSDGPSMERTNSSRTQRSRSDTGITEDNVISDDHQRTPTSHTLLKNVRSWLTSNKSDEYSPTPPESVFSTYHNSSGLSTTGSLRPRSDVQSSSGTDGSLTDLTLTTTDSTSDGSTIDSTTVSASSLSSDHSTLLSTCERQSHMMIIPDQSSTDESQSFSQMSSNVQQSIPRDIGFTESSGESTYGTPNSSALTSAGEDKQFSSALVHSRLSRRSSVTSVKTGSDAMYSEEEEIVWKKGNELGKGAFGIVWRGLTNGGQIIAVKQVELRTSDMDTAEKQYEKLQEEVSLLKSLRHVNIVSYIGACLEDGVVNIFMEFVPGGSIASVLKQFGPLDESVYRYYTKQIVTGVEYIHGKNVVHRDIKGGNIMIMSTGIIKLIDFGCAKRLCIGMSHSNKELLRSVKGTPYWMAPEVITETGHGFKSDIWSIGCTVYEMAKGKPPWSHLRPMPAILAIGQGSEPPRLDETYPEDARDFVACSMIRDPDQRWSAEELLSHPFIKNCSAT